MLEVLSMSPQRIVARAASDWWRQKDERSRAKAARCGGSAAGPQAPEDGPAARVER
jgi:hypothetical protein